MCINTLAPSLGIAAFAASEPVTHRSGSSQTRTESWLQLQSLSLVAKRVLHRCTAGCQAAAMADVPPPQQPKKRPKKPPPATERADLATLYCLQATARCALDGCAVCAHRICQHGAPGRPLPPPQRPESCPRVVDESPGPDLGQLYGGCRVLTVGDGDLSFSVALAERGECASLTASTLEPDLEALQREYDGLDVRGHARRICLLYTSPSPRDQRGSRMPSSA